MKCQCCQKREATMHVNDVDEWKTTDIVHICFECASLVLPQLFGSKGPLASANDMLVKARRLYAQDASLDPSLDDADDDALAIFAKATEALIPKLACSSCGMSFTDFQKTGRLGCPECYETFDKLLAPALERIHGVTHTTHKGRKPGEARVSRKMAAIRRAQDLKNDLEKALSAENYEHAAEIRDEMAALEHELKTTEENKA